MSNTNKIMLYLISKLNEMDLHTGRKKLMKLMFLFKHYSIDSNKLVKSHGTPKFIVYKYGPFSFEVMDSLIELNREKKIEEITFMQEVTNVGKTSIDVDERDKECIDKIVKKFGNKNGLELEKLSLELLNMTKEDKKDVMGTEINDIIR